MATRLLVCAASLATAAADTNPAAAHRHLRGGSLAQPDWAYYHKTDEIFGAWEQYAAAGCPELKVERISDASDHYSVDSMKASVTGAGAGLAGTRKAGALVVFGEHARELISSEIGLRLVAMICAPWAESDGVTLPEPLAALHTEALATLQQFERPLPWLTALLQQVDLRLVPVENPNGRRMVESDNSKLCHRMNGRMVDINRNFDNHWGVHPEEYLPAEEYEGTAPFSEPEARITRDMGQSLKDAGGFDTFVSIHAGIKELYLPYDHKREATTEPAINDLLSVLNKKHCQCNTGSAAMIGGYRAMGTATGYMYEIMNVKYTYTWEVVGDLKASNHDCFRMFNPVTKTEFDKEVSNWAAAILTLLDEVVRREVGPWETSPAEGDPAAPAHSSTAASSEGVSATAPGTLPAEGASLGAVGPTAEGVVPAGSGGAGGQAASAGLMFDPAQPDKNPGPRRGAMGPG